MRACAGGGGDLGEDNGGKRRLCTTTYNILNKQKMKKMKEHK